MSVPSTSLDVETAVKRRYSEAAKAPEASLCCPTSYDPRLLEAIPEEVLARDYGCGNPSEHVRPGETVLDLGSGSGKICFIASQVVGPTGRVIGVDMNDDMLSLARKSAPEVARRIGYGNVRFVKGRIQDLALDLEGLDRHLREQPVRSADDLARLEAEAARLREQHPLVPSDSVDVVVSSCVLNLVRPELKKALFGEIFRVLRRGGRAVISDIVADEEVPESLQRDPELWSGCISGALQEERFLEAFEAAGFYGVTLVERGAAPWRTVEGLEFRSVTVVAYKGKEGPCLDQKHAVIYRGPFREVTDDDGHRFRRGVRTAVCEKTFRLFSSEPYGAHVEPVPPRVLGPLESAPPFVCTGDARRREPRETKGEDYRETSETAASACAPGGEKQGGCC
ncbi:MAG: methyltransferase domain-containing protein [Deltaproteobacteria bacterium]